MADLEMAGQAVQKVQQVAQQATLTTRDILVMVYVFVLNLTQNQLTLLATPSLQWFSEVGTGTCHEREGLGVIVIHLTGLIFSLIFKKAMSVVLTGLQYEEGHPNQLDKIAETWLAQLASEAASFVPTVILIAVIQKQCNTNRDVAVKAWAMLRTLVQTAFFCLLKWVRHDASHTINKSKWCTIFYMSAFFALLFPYYLVAYLWRCVSRGRPVAPTG